MTKKLKRTNDFEIVVEIKNDDFIKPPNNAQRNSLLNNALNEITENLYSIDLLADNFVKGNTNIHLKDRTQEKLSDEEIMEDWQIPIMQAMAEIVTKSQGDVLEIGFGFGVASTIIQELGVKSHTIIECNDSVVERFFEWKDLFENKDIRLVHGLWQDKIENLDIFDGIFFHTYPLNEEEYLKYVHGRVTFAEHFFEAAAKHLREGGVFTYFSNEIDSLSRGHQRALFKHFTSIKIETIDLDIPEDVVDTWWANKIVIVEAVK